MNATELVNQDQELLAEAKDLMECGYEFNEIISMRLLSFTQDPENTQFLQDFGFRIRLFHLGHDLVKLAQLNGKTDGS